MKNELGTGKAEREGGDETGPLILSDIIDVPAIQSMMDDFFALTNIGVAVLDIHGKVLVATGWQDICTKFHRVHPETSRHCVESDTLLSKGVKPGTFKIYQCKNHMWDMATPIIVGGQHVGNLFLGQFLFADEQPDYALFREQARKYGFDETEYLSALERVPRWEKETVHRVMTFYSKFAQLISELSYANLRLARTLEERNTLFLSLQESEEKYRSLVQNSNDIIWAFDMASQKFTFSSGALERILGYPMETAPNLTMDDVFSSETKKEVMAAFGKAGKRGSPGGQVFIEAKHRHQNGSFVWMEISATALKDGDGKVVGFAGVTRDIRERKMAEAERAALEADRAVLQVQNWQLQKAESLGRMAGAVAHHFNNQLQAVIGNLELAMHDVPGSPGSFETLMQAMKAAREAATVSGQMLTYLGQTVGRRETLDLAEACRLVLPVLQAGMPGNIVLKTDLPSPGPAVNVNRSQMEQVLTNLFNNAQEGMAGGSGDIHVTVSAVSSVDIPAKHRFPIDWTPEADAYACIEVKDDGPGILEQDLGKVFDPFFSTKFTGRGLGLPVALGIVRAHGGCIAVESRVGGRRTEDRGQRAEGGGLNSENLGVFASLRENPVGSVFRVYLPLSAETVPQQPEKAVKFQQVQAGGLVLLVEDTEQVRKLGVRMLELLGCGVLAAKDGVEGVEIFRERRDDIGFVLCDLTMPRMDGWKTLEALRKIRPDVRVILSSGYDEASVMSGDHPEWPQAFLAKPYSLEDLREAIGRIIEPQIDTDGHR